MWHGERAAAEMGAAQVPFNASIDIRDTVNYKQVMKQ